MKFIVLNGSHGRILVNVDEILYAAVDDTRNSAWRTVVNLKSGPLMVAGSGAYVSEGVLEIAALIASA